MTKKDFQYLGWGFVAGVIVFLLVAFPTGWVTTTNSAKEMAKKQAHKAVVEHLADVCVAQYKQDPLKGEKFKELKKTDMWERDNYVKKQGWAKMPGSNSTVSGVADRCAAKILEQSKE